MKKRKDDLFDRYTSLIRILSIIFVFLIFALVVSVGLVVFSEFSPDKISVLDISEPASFEPPKSPYSALIWNIGYAGLGKEADFFIEGGTMAKAESKVTVKRHLDNILDFLKQESADLIFLQEVDLRSSRSYDINQLALISYAFPNHFSSFAFNYKVLFTPIPVNDPIGGVSSGLLSLSNAKVTEAKRFSIASVEKLPDKYFHLKRALLLQNIELDEKNLSAINIHLSAFAGQDIRDKQLFVLKELILTQKAKGNAVIVAGDWNMELPDSPEFETTEPYPDFLDKFPKDWIPEGFQFVYETNTPTVRTNEQPYTKGKNFRTIIDAFLVSDDIKIIDSKTFDLDFVDSDHNPAMIEFEIV